MTRQMIVFGASGQVGRATLALLGDGALGLDHGDADFSKPESLPKVLDRIQSQGEIQGILNCAAYTAVDQAEKEEALAHAINAESPGALARWCAERRIPLVHYSTDYVFSGEGSKPWQEEDRVGPLSAYGRTKLAGEQAVSAAGGYFLIFRTSWVFDAYGKNFVRTMLKLGAERESLKVVADQHGAPTYAPHLARATLAALKRARSQATFPVGIYHLCNSGETTWHAFATEIFETARRLGLPLAVKSVEPIPTSAFPTPAKRPSNSRMNTERAAKVLDQRLPHWREGLAECMSLLKKELK